MFKHIFCSIKRLLNDECDFKQQKPRTTLEIPSKRVFKAFEGFLFEDCLFNYN